MDLSQLLRALGLQQAYQSYQQNIGQPFANIAGPFGRGLLGLERPEYGEEQAYRTGQAMGNMPAVSAPVGAFKAAAQVPGLLADASQAMKGLDLAGLLGLTAYHGSPYRFSKFDPTKIGTGEGAQAYGYGHYFAEAPAVAKGYRDKLSTNVTVDGAKLQTIPSDSPMAAAHNMTVRNIQNGMSPQEAIAATNKYWTDAANEMRGFAKSNPELIERIEKEVASRMEIANAANSLKPGSFYRDPGSLYTVDIPDEMIGRMLDYDKKIIDQPQVLQAIRSQLTDPDLLKSFDANVKAGISGANAMQNWLMGAKTPAEKSEVLRKLGIPGISYLDQGSRGAGQGTRNFVVFPGQEEAIKMLKVE